MIALFLLAAASQAPAIRDSAGVTIVENPAPASSTRALVVAARPTVQIGAEEGDPNLLFNGIVAAARGRDGSLFIADRGSAEIRVFDAAGRFVRTLGRKGGGPGEFQSLAHIWLLPGDSLGAWDAGNGRLTIFAPGGAVARTFTPQGREGLPPLVGLARGPLRDGSFFGYQLIRATPTTRKTVMRDTLLVGRYRPDGSYGSAVGRFLGLELIKHAGGSMPGPDGVARAAFSMEGIPFAHEAVLRAGADRLHVSDQGSAYQILVYGPSGRLERIIRLDREPRRVAAADIARFRTQPVSPGTISRPGPNPTVDEAFIPKTMPAIDALRLDASGRLWTRDFVVPGETGAQWHVFDREGKLLGTAATPTGVEVLEIGTDYLLGVWRDEADVEYLRVYDVSPGTGR